MEIITHRRKISVCKITVYAKTNEKMLQIKNNNTISKLLVSEWAPTKKCSKIKKKNFKIANKFRPITASHYIYDAGQFLTTALDSFNQSDLLPHHSSRSRRQLLKVNIAHD